MLARTFDFLGSGELAMPLGTKRMARNLLGNDQDLLGHFLENRCQCYLCHLGDIGNNVKGSINSQKAPILAHITSFNHNPNQ